MIYTENSKMVFLYYKMRIVVEGGSSSCESTKRKLHIFRLWEVSKCPEKPVYFSFFLIIDITEMLCFVGVGSFYIRKIIYDYELY